MGCDIHMLCEELKTVNCVKKWFNADHWVLNEYFGEDESEQKYEVVELCGSRDYSTFTALCGVRDYTGKSPKISEPRGLPKDCSDEAVKLSDRWSGDGHSHSYATLKEVKQFVKNNDPVKFSGLVSQRQADELDNNGVLPTVWCQSSSDKTMVFREWEDKSFSPLKDLYKLMANRFNQYRNPDDIDEEALDNFRIVFWFDN